MIATMLTAMTAEFHNVALQHGLGDVHEKVAKALTEDARSHIKSKNFALSGEQSSTGKPAYPIQSRHQAGVAMGMVGMHGSSQQKAEVYRDVARKYPDLARHSDVPAARAKVKESTFLPGTQPLPGMSGGPPGGMSAAGMGMGAAPLGKAAGVAARLGGALSGVPSLKHIGDHLAENSHMYDLAGLGILAAPSAVELGHEAHKGLAGETTDKGTIGKSIAEIGGLGVLAAPVAAQLALGRH